MIKKDKLARNDIRFYLIPFISLAILFAVLAYNFTYSHVRESYARIEESALSIAESYSANLKTSGEATKIITDLLDEKILLASEAVLLADNIQNSLELKKLADKFQVDQINLFSVDGEVLFSNIDEYVGWKALAGHPVFDFMTSDQQNLVEDIRADTETGILHKFGYVKKNDNTFVQIGVRADNIYNILSNFSIPELINNITDRENVELVFFTDNDDRLISSNRPEYARRLIKDISFRENHDLGMSDARRIEFDGTDILHVCTPVYLENELIGTLILVWSVDIIDGEIINIIFRSLVQFIIVILAIGIILNYAYRKSMENIRIAFYDKLTGLPNREYLEEYLEQVIKTPSHKKRAVLLLNFSNIRTINMTYGFLYGNQILKQIANKIKNEIAASDVIFRFGADRFVLVVDNYKDIDELKIMAADLVRLFDGPFAGDVKHEDVSAEAAVLEIPGQGISVDNILRDISLALIHLKQYSSEHIIFYDHEMEVAAQRQDIIEKAIKAIIQGQSEDSLYLVFQPKLDLKSNMITGFEALARMNIQSLGEIPPQEFILLAEKRMLMYDLGNLILRKACDFLAQLKNVGFEGIHIAVNISSIQILRDEFTEDVKQIAASAGINLESLEFEITETVLIDNYELVNENLEKIKSYGISISLDDFGTGFSSFARLSNLNIDKIKIDKYFIDKISVSADADLISADLISMAHKIGLTVIAEGVENEKQMEYLKKYNCDVIQGYLISRPLSTEDAIIFL